MYVCMYVCVCIVDGNWDANTDIPVMKLSRHWQIPYSELKFVKKIGFGE